MPVALPISHEQLLHFMTITRQPQVQRIHATFVRKKPSEK